MDGLRQSAEANAAPAVANSGAVVDELGRVLGSECFQRSTRQRRFLSLIVEQALLGKAGRIKEAGIAVAVYGRRAATFDAQHDPIVRVEAARLRDKLRRYYATEGASARVRIDIPKGHYRPVFFEVDRRSVPRVGMAIATPEANNRSSVVAPRSNGSAGWPLPVVGTRDPRARDCYERGRYAAQLPDSARQWKAIELFRQAVAIDGRFAEAHAALAMTLLNAAEFGDLPSDQYAAEARAAALQAIRLDPESADSYVALATLTHRIERDWPASEALYRRALALAPYSASCHIAFGLALAARNRFADSVMHMKHAIERDPLNMGLRTVVAQVMCYAHDYTSARETLTRILEVAPNHAFAEFALGFAEIYAGRPRAARQAFERARNLAPRHPGPRLCEAAALALDGSAEEARIQMAALLEQLGDRYYSRYHLAIAYAWMGEHRAVYDALAKAAGMNDMLLVHLPAEPAFHPLHEDARFRALLRRYGLPVPTEDCDCQAAGTRLQ